MPLQATSGAASQDAFGGNGVAVVPTYIEDVFSIWLYKGNDSTQTITNGIDLTGKGGLVFLKNRSNAYGGFAWYDTLRGAGKLLVSNSAAAQVTAGAGKELTSFNSTGFSLGANDNADVNLLPDNYASWTFRKQPKFFDVVTYTGTGSNTTIAHSLGSVPACIIVKRTDANGAWQVYHRSLANTEYLVLNTTAAKATGATRWNSTTPTSSVFSLGTDATVNASGGTYVAYIFAHDAGGFGLTGTDNVISCGSFTTDSGGAATVSLGYEPQWLLVKKSSSTGTWYLLDVMRGLARISFNYLVANTSAVEESLTDVERVFPLATGFQVNGGTLTGSAETFIYIAIRRGPMKVPTDGTKVYNATTGAAYSNPETVSVGFPPDLVGINNRGAATGHYFVDRLRGGPKYFTSTSTAAEADDGANKVTFDTQNSATVGGIFGAPYNGLFWFFRRAPSFMDAVCYTGTGSATTFSHNLAAVPELMIVKKRSAVDNWIVYHKDSGNSYYLSLNTTSAKTLRTNVWNATTPTASVFSLGDYGPVNDVSATYVAYLFATCAGVSKVGSYTGTAATLQIDCGFTAGARFVLIKRTDSTGDWYVWDTARGIVSGNDSYLLLNSTAAEVTNTDYIDTYSAGFEISSTAPAAINASGGSFIFFAVA